MDCLNKGVVITGAASGIGLATAIAFAERGAHVVLADIEEIALARAASHVAQSARGMVRSFVCDVSQAVAFDSLAAFSFETIGDVHILFSNAGVGVSGPLTSMTREDWDWVLGVNLWGAVNGINAFIPHMIRHAAGGHVVINSSFAGLVYDRGLGPYCVSKAAVIALAEVLRQEMRDMRIGVSVVCPMRVDTEIGSSHRNRSTAQGRGSAARDVTDPRDTAVPGKIISPSEVASRIIDAVDHNELYVMTHEDGRPFVAHRFARIDKCFARQHSSAGT